MISDQKGPRKSANYTIFILNKLTTYAICLMCCLNNMVDYYLMVDFCFILPSADNLISTTTNLKFIPPPKQPHRDAI